MSPKLSITSKINGGEESSDMEDIECFYIGFVVSFGAILLGLAAVLCFNTHWRKAWFRMIEALMFVVTISFGTTCYTHQEYMV
uniref:Putative ovule protein n=1 Tax=Solanum chacoense TaxID=4108 RepID=A0A0V0GQQ1_SOLCH